MNPDKYFDDYEDLAIHEIMLRDRPRQEAYYNAILKNSSLFKGKTVIDVGAGTGILSAFCAKAGAKQVYAVEASNLAEIALNVIHENNLSSIVKVIQTKIEDFELPTDNKVDIIVSEWMGFYLLHEGMLDSVIFARDTFLKPDGLMFPQNATIYVSPCSIPSRFDYWANVDGIKMNTFAKKLREQKSHKLEILQLQQNNLLHDGIAVAWFNLQEVTLDELNEIKIQEVVPTQRSGKHEGFCIWFDCQFPGSNLENTITLSTSPNSKETHWKQSVIVLPEEACDQVEENTPIAFSLIIQRSGPNKRKYNLEMELQDVNVVEHPVPCDCFMTKCILTKAHLQQMDTA